MIDHGGYVFPTFTKVGSVGASEGGLTRRDWFATFAPEPDPANIQIESRADALANPHGDSHKPKRRSTLEIITDLKFAYADAMIARSKK